MQVSGEDVRGNRCSPRGYLSQLVRSLVVSLGDVEAPPRSRSSLSSEAEVVGDRYPLGPLKK